MDTTCPWVSKVWNTVDTHQRKGLTSIIHGKYAHEETVATTSFCEEYICVKNMEEAEMVVDYILNGGDKEAFLKHFENAISKGFDPDTMLTKVGLANQTTMYKKETKAIGQLFQKALMKKYGPSKVDEHYFEFDTICDATQVRTIHMNETNIFYSFSHSISTNALFNSVRRDKMLYQNSSITPKPMAWTSFLSLVDGIPPTQPTCSKSHTWQAFDPSTLIRQIALKLTIPLPTEQLMEKSLQKSF